MTDTPTPQRPIWMVVNGQPVEHTVDARLLLSDFLRHTLGLTGTHVGCEHGVCGACTVLMDGDSVRSCITLAVQADGAAIDTVEAMGRIDALSPLQEAFRTHHGLQCGFCTPGMLATCSDALSKYPLRNDAEIRDVLSGNLCRCTGYQGIVAAVRTCVATRDLLRHTAAADAPAAPTPGDPS